MFQVQIFLFRGGALWTLNSEQINVGLILESIFSSYWEKAKFAKKTISITTNPPFQYAFKTVCVDQNDFFNYLILASAKSFPNLSSILLIPSAEITEVEA